MGAINNRTIVNTGSDVVSTEMRGNDKTLMATIGDIYGSGYTFDAEVWQPWGYAGRPAIADPSANEPAAQALSINMSSQNIIFGFRDARHQQKSGNLLPGDNCMYSGGQGRILLKNTGDVALMTTKGNTDDGTGCTIQLLASGAINLASEFGGISLQEDSLTLMSAKGSGAVFSSDGVTVNGKAIALNGMINLGGPTATGVATLQSMTAFNAALAIKLTTLDSAITAIAAVVAALTPVTGLVDPGALKSTVASLAIANVLATTTGVTPLLGTPISFSSTVSASA